MITEPAFRIRQAEETDVSSILECLAEAFAPYRTQYTKEAFLDTVLTSQTIKHRMSHMTTLVAESQRDGKVIGTVAYNLVTPEEGHIRGMAVLPSCQGIGVAQQLLERIES